MRALEINVGGNCATFCETLKARIDVAEVRAQEATHKGRIVRHQQKTSCSDSAKDHEGTVIAKN